jgi:hypothetical protein
MATGLFSVYLGGPIAGLSYFEATVWRDYVLRAFDGICPDIRCFSPMRHKPFLQTEPVIDGDAASRVGYSHPLASDKGIVARDRMDCTRADLILFNLVEQPDRLFAGTCIEIGWGDAARIPMVAALTPGSVWDHPMVRQMIPFIVPSLDEAIELIPTILMPERIRSAYQVN